MDILEAADEGRFSLLILLDLSSAFALVNHNISINKLYLKFGFKGLVQPMLACKRTQNDDDDDNKRQQQHLNKQKQQHFYDRHHQHNLNNQKQRFGDRRQ